MWAIEYGYTLKDKDLKKILSRCAEPQLAFATDQDTNGPDPLARRYDFSKEPLDFANNQMRMAKHHRKKIVEDFVEEGDSWDKARTGYLLTLSMQTKATGMMANWIGGTFVHRDKKGDPNGRKPIEVVPVDQQRKALDFVIKNTMFDEAYGLSPDLLLHMTSDSWSFFMSASNEPAWPVHDRIMGIQAMTLSQLLQPATLRRVYDNEYRIDADEDALTLYEMCNTVSEAVWQELGDAPEGDFSERKPAISSLRRNLQSEHLGRLFDLANMSRDPSAAMKPISNIASMQLTELGKKVDKAKDNDEFDAYTRAHLQDASERIKKWIDSKYVMQNGNAGGATRFFFGRPAENVENK